MYCVWGLGSGSGVAAASWGPAPVAPIGFPVAPIGLLRSDCKRAVEGVKALEKLRRH